MNPDLQKYIAEARAAGKTPEIIKSELSGAGWNEADITQALSGIVSSSPATPLMQGGMVAAPAVAVSAGSGMNFLIGLAVLLLVAGGGFFAYMYTSGSAPNNPATPPQNDLSGTTISEERASQPPQTSPKSEPVSKNSATIPTKLECNWNGINKVTVLDNKTGRKTEFELKDGTNIVNLESGTFDAFANARPQFCFEGYFEILELAREIAPGFNTDGKWFALADGNGHRRLSVVIEEEKSYLIDEYRISIPGGGGISISLQKISLDTGFVWYEVKDILPGPDYMLSRSTEDLTEEYKLGTRTISYN